MEVPEGRLVLRLLIRFGIKLYDKEMLARAAKESGICEEIFETHDEKPTNSFLYSLVMDTYSMGYSGSTYTDMPINHKVFLAQFDAIKKIADEWSVYSCGTLCRLCFGVLSKCSQRIYPC